MLLITGILAKDIVEKYTKESRVESEVLALKIQVAALLKIPNISNELKTYNIQGVDLILVPGLIKGDTSIISKSIGIPAFKGPKYAADLLTVLDSLNKIKLSTIIPACELFKEELRQKAIQELELIEKNSQQLLNNPGNMAINDLIFGKDFPMRIMAEIVDAPLLSSEEVQNLAKRYVNDGASIIDVGMIAGESRPLDARRIVEDVKSAVNVPVSIDTLNSFEAKQAVSAGADLILSIDAGNVEEFANFVSDIAVVAIPSNQREGYFLKDANQRVIFLENIIKKARKLGITNILADLIVEPSAILRSFIAFGKFAKRNPDIPMFVGTANFTELIDADSVGINALLARLSSEVGASILLATEKSVKAKGTVKELSTAAKMMFLAKKRGSVPKDLGLDLLILKDKRLRGAPYNSQYEKEVQIIYATSRPETDVIDEKGIFKIAVDKDNGSIVAIHFSDIQQSQPTVIIKGETAEEIYSKILEMGLITRIDHSAYLGRELA
ncbi:MAG: dihydropteroate synthase-like protein, partial [Candidatus Bathyarchaeota archaeon]